MEEAVTNTPLPQIHKATFFCEDMGLRICFRGFYLKNRGAALFVHNRVLKK